MDTAGLLLTAEELVNPLTTGCNPSGTEPDGCRHLCRTILEPAVTALIAAHWGYLSAITGLDYPGLSPVASAEKQWNRLTEETELDNEQHEGHIEVALPFLQYGAAVTLRVLLPYNKAVLPTLCDIIPSATLYEREIDRNVWHDHHRHPQHRKTSSAG